MLPKALLPSPNCCSPAAQGPAAQPADKAPLNCFTSPTTCRCAAVPPSPTASCCAAVPLPSLAAHRCAYAPLHMCNTAPLHCLTSPTASRCCRSAAAPLYLSAWTWLPCCTELITARSHGQQQQQQQQQQSSHYISFRILLLQWATQMHGVNDAARRHRPETDGRGGATFSRQSCVWTNTPIMQNPPHWPQRRQSILGPITGVSNTKITPNPLRPGRDRPWRPGRCIACMETSERL